MSEQMIIKQQRPWFGASWKIAAFACYAGLNAIARYLTGGAETTLTQHLPVTVIVFCQDLIALLILLPWIMRQKPVLPTRHYPLHLLRVFFSATAIMAWYFALVFTPLAQAVALSIIGPVMGVLLARYFLKEKQGLGITLIICLSLTAAVWVIKPQQAFIANASNVKGLMFIGLSSLCFAIAKIATRRLAQLGEAPQRLTFYLFIFIVPLSFIPALSQWVTPEWVHLPWLFLAGVLTALAIFCVSTALAYANVTFLAPFDLCQFFLNTLVGYIAFMELPAPWVIWLLLAFLAFTLTARKKLA